MWYFCGLMLFWGLEFDIRIWLFRRVIVLEWYICVMVVLVIIVMWLLRGLFGLYNSVFRLGFVVRLKLVILCCVFFSMM